MKKWVLLLSTVFLFQCQTKKGDVNINPVENLIGKWEATYTIRNSDTTFYDRDSLNSCAYIILAYDYNSGFELRKDQTGDLIWCGNLKNDLFDWSFRESTLFVSSRSGNTDSLEIYNLSSRSIDLRTSKGHFYHMEKY